LYRLDFRSNGGLRTVPIGDYGDAYFASLFPL